ncbi:MAG TPA: PEP-CTERM sorting domain-containing protein [Candidatus Brocadiia bacterium]|nr:PEP-CTERM sorting domain-containing protein [Candidatus Brocadiia bacterium]
MKKTLLAARLALILACAWSLQTASADVITLWDFESTTSNDPVIGSGTQGLLPDAIDNSSLAVVYFRIGSSTTAGSGLEWEVSTAGYENVTLSIDMRRPDGSANARNWTWQYDLGSGWVDASNFSLANQIWNNFTLDLSAISGASNNPNFKFGVATTNSPNFSVTVDFDNITVSGTPVPEPGAFVLMAVGLGGIAVWRRRK